MPFAPEDTATPRQDEDGADNYPAKYSPVLYNIQKMIGVRKKSGTLNLKRLTPKHKQIIALYLSTVPMAEIADMMNLTYQAVSRIISDPLSQQFINTYEDGLDKEFKALRTRYVQVMRDGLTHNDIRTRLRAADQYARASGQYDKDSEGSGLTAEDVIQRILQINVQVNNNA